MGRILFLISIGLGGAAVLISLGVWQVQRLSWKQAVLADITTRIAAAPVELPSQADPVAMKYLPVAVTGTFDDQVIYVLVSQKQIGAGYRVISPMVTDAGRRVLIDRGFVRVDERDAVTTPTGAASVTGNLHWPEEIDSFTPQPDLNANIWFARDLPAMSKTLNTEPLLIIARETSLPDGPVTPLPVDTAGIPNNHLQYAITWFSLALIWVGMTLVFALRGSRRRPERPNL
ncbi:MULTISPECIES: SURF1 family protein [Roseobacteraceae]|uniref:SURF1-like protein n=1 Tax=Pseudosulfitobacter pseudonitzschiae TaxID=1402135 RepID=A0A221K226_9RHOB|nr:MULTISPECIES: SURF1 family protein [Roseobacteraceae]ASM72963.1 SURF1 family protein [Pseudosulfitobacter pseudonitzschiae]